MNINRSKPAKKLRDGAQLETNEGEPQEPNTVPNTQTRKKNQGVGTFDCRRALHLRTFD